MAQIAFPPGGCVAEPPAPLTPQQLAKVREKITPRTRAVLAVNLFGHPAALHELRALCDEHGLALVERD